MPVPPTAAPADAATSHLPIELGAARITFIGVRHHSPACASLVRDTIRALRPAHVLIEGPADMNDRLGELLLGHDLPIAVFTSYRDTTARHMSWAPFCDYSPEWVGLTEGRAVGAAVRFIDLPAWHTAFHGAENRYADTERRYDRAVARLCREFAVDNVDALWDHLFELSDTATLPLRLATYFDLVRGDDDADTRDLIREEYMARWVHAAVTDITGGAERDAASTVTDAASPVHIVVVTGGFHRPALIRRLRDDIAHGRLGTKSKAGAQPSAATIGAVDSGRDGMGPAAGHGIGDPTAHWPEVPVVPEDGSGGSYLVPFSFRRLDAFGGYQSGMPSPAYYQRLWEHGPDAAAEEITRSVVRRLRMRGQAVSTASLIGARTLTVGLSRLRGHESPSRTDVLDGLAGTLITEALDRPLPWTGRGQLPTGTDPVVVEMVAALSGDTVGRLHEATPHPPLVRETSNELARCGIPEEGRFHLDLGSTEGLDAGRVLHRLRVIGIPGFARISGPAVGRPPVSDEEWKITPSDNRLPALIEAGSLGATCAEAAATRLDERFAAAGSDSGGLADVLFDATLCGLSELSERIVDSVRVLVESASEPTGLGRLLAVTLGLWRHDRLFGTAQSPTLATLVDAAVRRLLWLVEGVRGGPAPADDGLLHALVAIRDAALHADAVLTVERADVAGVFSRCTAPDRPPALRGAAVGAVSILSPERTVDIVRSVRLAGTPELLGDFLAGLFALAREELLEPATRAITPNGENPSGTGSGDLKSIGRAAGGMSGAAPAAQVATDSGDTDLPPPALLAVLDELVGGFGRDEFLAALPALRLAFAWFPPRERARIASRLLEMRGLVTSATALLRLDVDAGVLARAQGVELRVDRLLAQHGLLDATTGEGGHD
ncbi:hypothetical protein JK358_31730 [Nocardia sp. 2]|uniref:Uncharacterized protein n=1 Tax=Nocardia acididurans TaxID=2802282 RepID=A0ABS1MH42_9NOCA|nr:DUF5682 family protein [Nocardia acididurans]MBL1078984.1 hypothetical protein [Nocardia acididurans]